MEQAANRRQFSRHPISLSALLHPEQGRSWLCNIRDFCEAGMLLVGAGGGRAAGRQTSLFRPGATVSLHFSVATPTGSSHFRTRGQIARVSDDGTGVGVRFARGGLPQEAFDALVQYAVAAGTAFVDTAPATEGEDEQERREVNDIPEAFLRDARVPEQDALRLRARMKAVTERAMQRVARNFVRYAKEDLLIKARDAGTNAVQMMYFEGLELIESQHPRIEKGVLESVVSQVQHISDIEDVLEKRRRRQAGESQQLALVDTEQFEDWLAVAEIISKTENRFTEELLDLRALLGMLAKPWSHKDVLPVGPAVIMWALADTLKGYDLRRQVRHDLYRCFEAAMVPVLVPLYEALVKLLGDSGVFPSVEDVRRRLAESAVRRNASGVRVDPKEYEGMDTAVREAAMAADGVGRADANPFEDPAGTGQRVYTTARSLIGLERSARARLGQHRDELLAKPDARRADLFDTVDILDALGEVEAEFGDAPLTGRRVRSRLLEHLKARTDGRKALAEEDYDTLEMMENLVESITEDRFLTQGIRDWVRRLEITLNKLATSEPAFLRHEHEQPHSAMQMLNQLARLGNSQDVRDGIDREVGRRVDELLQRVVSEYDQNPEVFTEVVDELHPLVDRQTQAYRGNVERTIRASEGQQRLARARRRVIDEVAQRFEGKQVPQLLLDLLNPGWRNLLVHTHLRQGVDTPEWRDQLAIIDQLFGQMAGTVTAGDPAYLDPDELLRRVVAALNSISFDPSKRTPLVMKLSSVLVGDTAGNKEAPEMVLLPEGGAEQALGLSGVLPDLNPATDADDEGVRQDFEKALKRARRLQVGEWLATGDKEGRPLILTVAFVGDDNGSFVLVNRRGIKNQELDLKSMAVALHEGRITLLDDFDLPLMERASQRMLENMHNQLAFQASHDDLTQLLNRKEFEREVERAVVSALRDEHQHALLYIDLDQFKIINNTSGHTAGDELLRKIGDVINRLMKGTDALVARLGGDEFGVLMREARTNVARDYAEEVLVAIRSERFEWEGRRYSLSASIGLVFIDASTESVDAVMRHADEACYTAKDAGRNRVQEYELDDARMIHRHGVMEWVTQLDKALEENRLVLNCQRIASVSAPDLRTEGHYEILLTMRDELGETMPPTDFILAAETYNRMTIIDRWVIERVLAWLADHRSRLDSFGGFSINVSGHSVNDETFPDFVLEQFSKTQAPTSKVCFEITETAAIANLDNAVEFMNRMKIIGCRFSLDDFGTGLSSYSSLRNLPVDYVKIDGVFVKDINSAPGDHAVVRSINEIGHYMGKETIAEYVETPEILDVLKDIGVDYAQGFCIEKPCELTQLVL